MALAVVPPSQAGAYDALAFTVLITDGADNADFLDIKEIAVAEPGDETLIVRVTVGGWTIPAGVSVDFWFTAGGVGRRAVMFSDDSTALYSTCSHEGSVGYCVLPYASIESVVGDQLTLTRAISYAGVAQDYAPGLHYVPDGVSSPKGADYTLKGYTPADGSGAGPLLEEFLISGEPAEATAAPGESATVLVTVENPSDTDANYTLAVEGLPEGVTGTLDADVGSVPAGGTATANVTIDVDASVAEGTYSFNVSVMGPNGGNASIELSLTVQAGSSGGSGGTSTTAATATGMESTDNETEDQSNATAGGEAQATKGGDTPSIHVLTLLATLAFLVMVVRRRR